MSRVRVRLPPHVRTLAGTPPEVVVEVVDPPTIAAVLDALESRFPTVRGTLRERETGARRPLIRFYACGRDLSLEPPDAPLPEPVSAGEEPFQVVGAIAGG